MGALVIGILTGAAMPLSWGTTMKALIAWNVAVGIYLALVAWLIMRSDSHRIHQLARQEDSNAIFVLAVMSVGALISLAAIAIELESAKNVSGTEKVLH
jgi:uncharacterized membrane protein